MPVMRRVMKVFQGGGDTVHLPGEIVDAQDWKNRVSLENTRFIGPAESATEPLECECGRKWDEQINLDRHVARDECQGGSKPTRARSGGKKTAPKRKKKASR